MSLSASTISSWVTTPDSVLHFRVSKVIGGYGASRIPCNTSLGSRKKHDGSCRVRMLQGLFRTRAITRQRGLVALGAVLPDCVRIHLQTLPAPIYMKPVLQAK